MATPTSPTPGKASSRLARSITTPATTSLTSLTSITPQSTPRSPPSASRLQHGRQSISFHVRPRNYSEGHRMRWDAEAEARLQRAERELAMAQKNWSERQEIWIDEVETLREMKKECERFYRRRDKYVRNQGQMWRKLFDRKGGIEEETELSDREGGEDDDVQISEKRPAGGLLQRFASLPGTGTATPEESPASSQNSSRKSSFVDSLMRGGMFRRRDSV